MKDGNFVLLKINNRLVKTLVDTGANFSCVSMKFITSLRLPTMIVQSTNYKRLYTADRKTMLGLHVWLSLCEFFFNLLVCIPRLMLYHYGDKPEFCHYVPRVCRRGAKPLIFYTWRWCETR